MYCIYTYYVWHEFEKEIMRVLGCYPEIIKHILWVVWHACEVMSVNHFGEQMARLRGKKNNHAVSYIIV